MTTWRRKGGEKGKAWKKRYCFCAFTAAIIADGRTDGRTAIILPIHVVLHCTALTFDGRAGLLLCMHCSSARA